jgi:hypothetical protein
MSYAIEAIPVSQIAAEDPFAGRGVFLACGEEDVQAELDRAFGGTVPAVTWPGLGAWVDQNGSGLSPEELVSWWKGR